MQGRPVPDDAVRRARLRGRAHGVSQWNGVAIASRVGIDDVAVGFDGQPMWDEASEARALGATCGGVRVWSLYVPNGRTVDSPHYDYKLEWLAALDRTASGWLADDPELPIALVGDWNIAPIDEDVWDVEVFAHSTHVTERERSAFRAIESRFADVVRPSPRPRHVHLLGLHPAAVPEAPGHAHRLRAGVPALAARVTHAEIARDERKPGKKGTPAPSDHAPVVVDLD